MDVPGRHSRHSRPCRDGRQAQAAVPVLALAQWARGCSGLCPGQAGRAVAGLRGPAPCYARCAAAPPPPPPAAFPRCLQVLHAGRQQGAADGWHQHSRRVALAGATAAGRPAGGSRGEGGREGGSACPPPCAHTLPAACAEPRAWALRRSSAPCPAAATPPAAPPPAAPSLTPRPPQDLIDCNRLSTNSPAAMLAAYGVEACRACIVREVSGVFGAYGIGVDPRHLSLIADFMTQLVSGLPGVPPVFRMRTAHGPGGL